ncbi:MAG: hypothetical protein ACYDBY_15245 [Thermoanaerobaculia bacterium]
MRKSTLKRPSRRPSARGARPSPSRRAAELEADAVIEQIVAALGTRIREELERIRPAIGAGLEAGADVRLLSRAAVARLRSRLGAGA